MRRVAGALGALVLAASSLGCGEEEEARAPDAGITGQDAGTPAEDGGQVGEDAGEPDAGRPSAALDLRADNNRNGVVDLDDPTEDEGEDGWNADHGAVFLANLDDDKSLCPKGSGSQLPSDVDLPKCHDAADEAVNGDSDLPDLAPLRIKPWPESPDGTVGRLSVSSPGASYVRLFEKGADGTWAVFDPATGSFSTEELRAGVELLIEGKDIVRDRAVWDGYVDLTLSAQPGSGEAPAPDTVRMRVSPVMTFDQVLPVESLYATTIPNDGDSADFRSDLRAAVTAAGVPNPLVEMLVPGTDQWTQDYLEMGYMSMPAQGGGQHVVRVAYRSANIDNPSSATNPLRPAGKIAFTRFRGPDVAAIQQYNRSSAQDMDSLNSFGNTETIPPYGDYPLGRLFRGSIPSFHPDASMAKLLESQGIQPPVYIDTSWLLVGHVDETISFLPAATPRGWIVIANDPTLARQMLEQQVEAGNGDVLMFEGMSWYDWNSGWPYSAERTISQVLDDTDVMAESARSATEVDAQLATIKAATGITDAEIVRIPYLHQPVDGYSVAYQPGTVNGVVLNGSNYAAPETHGPVIGGHDIFKDQLEQALDPYGYTVRWVENWALYHALMGEVHCGSNAARAIPETRWWETGR